MPENATSIPSPRAEVVAEVGDTLVVEADTAEEALELARGRVGGDAEVLLTERIARGGIGGFFAREMVRVTVRATAAGGASPHGERTAPTAAQRGVAERGVAEARPSGVDAVLARLAADEDARERDFSATLTAELRREPPAPAAPSRPRVVRAPATDGVPPTRLGPTGAQPGVPTTSTGIPLDALPEPVRARLQAPETPAAAGTDPEAPAEAHEASVDAEALDVRDVLALLDLTDTPLDSIAEPRSDRVSDEHVLDDADVEEVPVGEATVEEGPVEPPALATRALARMRAELAPLTATSSVPSSRTPDAAPVPAPHRRAGSGHAGSRARGAAWSVATLQRLGVPATVADAVWAVPDGADEFTWMRGVAGAVELFCRDLPVGSSVLVGPEAGRLGIALGMPCNEPGEAPPYGGDVALTVRDEDDLAWVRRVRGDRSLHLVLGGARIPSLRLEDAAVVSWVGTDALPEALALCAASGMVLGYGIDPASGRAVRATPTDVAIALRSLLPRR